MFSNDFSANGQSHTGTFVNVSRMQALKYVEHAIGILFVEADSVVLDRDAALFVGGALPGSAVSAAFFASQRPYRSTTS